MTRIRIAIVALATAGLTAAVGVPTLQAAPTCEINWTGGASTLDWDTAANWDLNRVPAGGDDVCIGDLAATDPVSTDASPTIATLQSQHPVRLHGGTLTLQDTGFASTVPEFTLAGGDLRGGGRLVVTGDMRWSAGSQRDGGTTEVRGHLSVENTGAIWLASHRKLETKGTAAWTGSTFYVEQEAVWTNSGTLLLNSESGMPLWNTGLPTMPRLHNTESGVVRKNAGTGDTTVAIAFDNDGLVEVTSGTLRLTSNLATGSTGHFEGAVAIHGGTTSLDDGATFDGLRVTGGTLTVPAGATATGGDLSMTAGTIRGAGTVRVDGTFAWSGGDMSEGGNTWVGPDGHLTVNGGTLRLHGGRRLTTDGTGEYVTGTFYGHDNAIWENGGVLDLRAESGGMAHWNDGLGTKPLLRNKPGGTISRTSGTGTTTADWWLDNDGDGDVASGHVRFVAGSGPHVSSGRFGATADGWFALGGGTFLIGDGARFERLRVDGGTVSVAENATMEGGALDFTSGVLRGLGTIRANGLMRWTGGSMHDAGRTETGPTGRLEVAAPSSIWLGHRRVLHTGGTGEYTSGNWYFEQNAQWENSGSFDARSEQGGVSLWNIGYGDYPRIHNQAGGRLLRTQGGETGSTRLDAALENDGRIEVSSGELRLTGGDHSESTGFFGGEGGWASMVSGRLLAGDGATFDGLKVDGGQFDVAAGAKATGLDLHLSGGELGGDGTLQADGNVLWSGGSLRDQGTTRIGPEGHLRVDSPNSIWNGHRHTLRTDGTGEFVKGNWYFEQNALWENGGSFDARSEQGGVSMWNIGYGDYPRFRNLAGGTITKSAGTGETNIWLDSVNDGRLEPASGRVRLRGSDWDMSNGHFGGTGDGHGVVADGRFLAGEGATFGGVELAGGQLDVADGVTMHGTDVTINGGELGGPGTARATGTVTWTGGSMHDPGTTVIAPEGHLEIDSPSSIWLGYRRTLRTEGTGRWQRGNWYFEQEAKWQNAGAFQANSESGGMGLWSVGFGDWPSLANSGTITKNAGTGTTAINLPLTSSGDLAQETGELQIHNVQGETAGKLGATLLGGSLTVRSGGSLDGTIVAGAHVKVAGGVVAEAKNVELRAGSLGGRGTIRVVDELRWSGGQMVDDGHTDVLAGARLTIAGNPRSLVGRYLFTSGDTDWTSGPVSLRDGAVWQNSGTMLANAGSYIDLQTWGNADERGRFVNTGTIEKSSPGDTTLYGVENDGTLRVANGYLHANDLRQSSDGRVVSVLGSDENGLTTGRVHIDGSRARLGGILAAEIAAGHVPAAGDSHPAISWADWSGSLGTFKETELPAMPAGTALKATASVGAISFDVEATPAPRAPAAEAPAPEPEAEVEAPAATDELVAVDDRFVLRPGRLLRPLANDTVPAGVRVELVSRPRGLRVSVNRRGQLRVRLGRSGARRLKLRYRLVDADGRRSRVATVSVRVKRAR